MTRRKETVFHDDNVNQVIQELGKALNTGSHEVEIPVYEQAMEYIFRDGKSPMGEQGLKDLLEIKGYGYVVERHPKYPDYEMVYATKGRRKVGLGVLDLVINNSAERFSQRDSYKRLGKKNRGK